jgi:lipopolysaccharide export system protein LptA
MESVRGTGNTKVISSSRGNPDRVTSARELFLKFDAAGGIAAVEQSGDFKYAEGSRNASAEKASMDMAADRLTLSGSPRAQDSSQGFALTAKSIRMNRNSGDMEAEGEVKTTYAAAKADDGGAMFSGQGGEPVHATAQRMTASKKSGVAKFIGDARLWQNANIVEAPQITFDRDGRSLTADNAGSAGRVQTAFVQTDKKGKVTPVSVTAGKLVYSDNDRKARFEGGVNVKSADMTLVADHAEIFLKAKSAQKTGGKDSASQIERIESGGRIVLEEESPVRRVTGSRLTYSADEGKFVMTGEPGKSPSIFDAERGNLTGDSLTFYMHDDRVQIGSGENSRVVTKTRIKDEHKP